MTDISDTDRPEKIRLALANVLLKGRAIPNTDRIAEAQKKFDTFIQKMSPERLAVALRGLCNMETDLQNDLYTFLDNIVVKSDMLNPEAEDFDDLVSALNDELDTCIGDLNETLEDIFYPVSGAS